MIYRKPIAPTSTPISPFGDKPAHDDHEIDDIVAFLGTLTDRYKP
jgi:hypothetical protein